MQLTAHTDYALRVLMYLAQQPEQLVTINELANFFAVSKNHLVKVVHNLGLKGFVQTARGRGGGIRLARSAKLISVGSVVRELEGHFQMAECFHADKQGRCALQSRCLLPGVLGQAVEQFLQVLDQTTLADLTLPLMAVEKTRLSIDV